MLVSSTTRPPRSIASSAFVIRLRKTCVSWSRSPAIGGNERSNTRSTSTLPPASLGRRDRKSTRLNSSHGYISYAVFCLKKKKSRPPTPTRHLGHEQRRRHQIDHIRLRA